jgi:hypothetical protein
MSTQEALGANLVMELDAFVRSVVVSQSTPHAFFLGAGASISSGIPSAQRCIWEWKRSIFLSNNPGCEKQFGELSLPSVSDKIQKWLDKRGGYPQLDAPEEYSFYIEKCYPISEHRRLFFQSYVQAARPHLGYHLLCFLAECGFVNSVWTTNFDGLVARAAGGFSLAPIEIGIDSKERLPRQATKGELLCVSLHGDYRYDQLKNTSDELRNQEKELREALIRNLADAPLIVSGYSGRDKSVMDALRDVWSSKGNGSIYWCGFGSEPNPMVKDLIVHARNNNRTAFYVPTQGFDDLLYRLALLSVTGEKAAKVGEIVSRFGTAKKHTRTPFEVTATSFQQAIKSNAFPITCPAEALMFEPKEWPAEKRWRWVEDLTDKTGLVAVPYKKKILCLGTVDEVQTIFGDNIQGPIDRVPIEEKEKRHDDSNTKALLLRALVRSISKTTDIPYENREFLWDPEANERYDHDGVTYRIHDAARLALTRIGDLDYLTIMPSLHVTTLDGEEAEVSVTKAVRQAKLGYQHNKPFHEAMLSWVERIWNGTSGRFECPPGCASTFHFQLKKNPVFGKVAQDAGKPMIIKQGHEKHYRYAGFQLKEPQLVFCAKNGGANVISSHPIRGIRENRPYDFALTQNGFSPSVRLGVICTMESSAIFQNFLSRSSSAHQPSLTESDYLLEFPGFQTAFSLPIEIPSPRTAGWQTYAAPAKDEPVKGGALAMARNIIQAINAVRAATLPQVVIVCIPTAVDRWIRYETDDELFDLHDFVKAYCVQHGIATQFIQESTSIDKQQCRVWWWLSLALYVKAMRTPWLLDGLDKNTAFVGFGLSVNRKAEKGHQLVLGCSHIYNSQGIGLQYRLTKVENPIFIGRKNAYLSKDDARRVGETVRLLFWDAQLKLPDRVVFHKRTAFHRDEREGLLEALGDVPQVDMIELTVAENLRYVSSWTGRDGIQIGNYPVGRGTVLKQENYQALLWVHGATTAINPQKTYYQGKRRIPAPLILKRHSGDTPLEQISQEILGLSKMHWNTFDLYTRLPSTIESSNEIARIGALLDRFGSNSYDYRLFI